jgi:hypothetical protein
MECTAAEGLAQDQLTDFGRELEEGGLGLLRRVPALRE